MSELLPHGWVEATLEQVAFPNRPRELPSRFLDLPFVGMEHVEAQTMRLLGTVPAAQLKSSAVHFQKGDVLYGRLRPYLNKVLAPRFEGLCSAEFIAFAGREEISSPWLAFLLNTSEFVAFASHLNTGDRPRVDFEQLANYGLWLSPRPEQDRIVAEVEKQFSRLDAATAALKRVQTNLKRFRASVLKAACEGRLVPTEAELARKEGRDYEPADQLLKRILRERRARWEADTLAKLVASGKTPKDDRWKHRYREPAAPDVSILPSLPEGWCWASLRQLSWASDYGTSEKCAYDAVGVPVLRIPNVQGGRIDLSDLKRAVRTTAVQPGEELCVGDLIVIRTNGSKQLIGRCALIDQSLDSVVLHASYLIRFRTLLVGPWLCEAWDAPFNRAALETHAATSAGQYNVSMSELGALSFPLPPLLEILRISSRLQELRLSISRTMAECDASRTRALSVRRSILSTAFSGELVPQDPNDEPASALLERIRAERASAAPRRPRRNFRKETAHA